MHKDANSASNIEVFSSKEQFANLADSVFAWGIARNITEEGGATSLSQIKKLKEEVQEIEDALMAGDKDAAMDGVGDTQVVLLQICRLAGFDLVECLSRAYNEIKDRKGTMIDGVFVKESKFGV